MTFPLCCKTSWVCFSGCVLGPSNDKFSMRWDHHCSKKRINLVKALKTQNKSFSSLFHPDWLAYSLLVMHIFCVMFSSLPFDRVFLPLIVPAGQMTKMATLWPCSIDHRAEEENTKEKLNTPPIPLPQKCQIFISVLSLGFFCLSAHQLIGKHTTVLFC